MSEYTQKDYEAIEATVMASPRGRWFLAEFARRNRAADTHMLLEAIRRLERTVTENPTPRAGEEPTGEPSRPEATDEAGAMRAEHLKYFKGDEDLFETPPAPSLAVVEEQTPAPPAQPATQADAGAAPVTARPKSDPKDRVVFIRRASSKETSIPLADETEDPFSSARTQPVS